MKFKAMRAINLLQVVALLTLLPSQQHISLSNAFSLTTTPPQISVGILKTVLTKVLLPYSLYSVAVDKYANRKVEQMKTIAPIVKEDELAKMSRVLLKEPKDLRLTINKWNNIVMDPNDRTEWNRFIVGPLRKNQITAEEALLDLCGNYEFAYRSYVNFEEVSAICNKPFFNWRQFLFVLKSKGALIIQQKEEEHLEDNNKLLGSKEESKAVNNLEVTNIERFRFGLFLPITIRWYGKIMQCDNDADKTSSGASNLKIVWTKTEMKIGPRITIENPKVSVELSSQPWKVLKVHDGMICFQRGDIGYLVYDKGPLSNMIV